MEKNFNNTVLPMDADEGIETKRNSELPPMDNGTPHTDIKNSTLPPIDSGPKTVNSSPLPPIGQNEKKDMANGNVSEEDESKKDGEKEEKKEEQKMVGSLEIFKYGTCFDYFLMILGSFCAVCHGAALPSMIIVFGDMTDTFVNSGIYYSWLQSISAYLSSVGISITDAVANPSILSSHKTALQASPYNVTDFSSLDKAISEDLLDTMTIFVWYYLGIGGGVLIFGYGQVACWVTAAERQSHRIRVSFFRNIMRQEISWFDTHDSGELNTRLSGDVNKIQTGIGDKMGIFFQWTSSFLTGVIIGFVYGWKLTLVILAFSPLIVIAALIQDKLITAASSKGLDAYAKAGSVADEVIGAVRTVVAFGGQDKECERYNEHLSDAKATGIRKGLTVGFSMGLIYFIIFSVYGFGFWYGAKLVREDSDYTPGNVLIVFFSIMIAAFSLGYATPPLGKFSEARGAAFTVYQLIQQVPDIDIESDEGLKPNEVVGNVELRNVKFRYPARPEVQVLKGVSLEISRGETVALVGSSGCGKSTIIQLLQRFYDPEEGEICLDGNGLKSLNLKWLRTHIGIVSQEPILFATTIAENIRYGREGVTDQEIEAACRMANAHDFILNFPDKYETLVGERGAQMSGGQKQRIAIARALVRDPKILLLDEATSALDTESESVVQEALDKARSGRTTIVVAHRLSTIKTADKIAGFQEGNVVEKGTHDQLMSKGGVYATLVNMQTKHQAVDEEEEELIAEFTGDTKPEKGAHHLQRQNTVHHLPVDKEVDEKDKDKKDKKKEEEDEAGLGRILKMNAPEWPYILLGSLGAIVNGGVQPAFAIIFAEILGTFALSDTNDQADKVLMWTLLLVGVGFCSFCTFLLQGASFSISGENLTMRLRQNSFRALLRQDMEYFDDPKNTTGALTTRLATEAAEVQGASGAQLGSMFQNLANIGTGVIIGFVYGWQLTLVILAFIPIIGIAGVLQMKLLEGVTGQNKEALEEAGKTATEAIENIRTVASLCQEETMVNLYKAQLATPYKTALRKSHFTGIAFAASTAVMFFAYATAFYFGAYMIEKNEMTFTDVFKVFSAIVFGAMAMGEASAFAPDAGKAKKSASLIFKLLDREPKIDPYSKEGATPDDFTSAVTFKDIHFRYPNRPDVEVLQGLNLEVTPGETLALVGASGCGKSTTMQLIERFYDPESGDVLLDKHCLKDLNVQWLRRQIGIVSQEPVLFDCSIAENIAYGDNFREVPMAEIIEAARKANIHEFIQALPNGYDTMCGDKGTQLSGGQKQRVAIARGLVRNPKILLLDEATSALDTESEKIVQEALDKAREGRTCIVIAHRLSTIQNANKICVVKHGQVAEQGRHGDLMSKQGIYARLVNTANKRGKN
ncbi:ATP-dependent translocase ABCB1-like isoform X2 [Ostrea edulis]|uniref:ATP-dependent translocase ABCB1-like isoform X2 n=1 Tax=Ostrea edulis TaxID=37623 RepID=UPI0024AEB85D|nr:ATP-dependent translocase ABCB1-like isoform X2 [Ostrea edulis]